jgi:hypothetical protein
MLLAQPRIFRAVAHDGLLPPAIASIHPRFRTPRVATIGSFSADCRRSGWSASAAERFGPEQIHPRHHPRPIEIFRRALRLRHGARAILQM